MARWLVAMALGLIVLGCGPSLRRSQQSRVYFERCYAADFDPRIAVAEKHACWTAWLGHYTIGQPLERQDYARGRLYAIEHGESVPRLPGLPSAALGPRTATPVTVASEEPEDASAPSSEEPAPAAAIAQPRSRRERHAPPLPRMTNAICAAAACEAPWRSCVDACAEAEACETACEIELMACARGCF